MYSPAGSLVARNLPLRSVDRVSLPHSGSEATRRPFSLNVSLSGTTRAFLTGRPCESSTVPVAVTPGKTRILNRFEALSGAARMTHAPALYNLPSSSQSQSRSRYDPTQTVTSLGTFV